MNEEFLKIEEKNKELIDIAKKYMSKVEDPKHSTIHMESVVKYVKEIFAGMSCAVFIIIK